MISADKKLLHNLTYYISPFTGKAIYWVTDNTHPLLFLAAGLWMDH